LDGSVTVQDGFAEAALASRSSAYKLDEASLMLDPCGGARVPVLQSSRLLWRSEDVASGGYRVKSFAVINFGADRLRPTKTPSSDGVQVSGENMLCKAMLPNPHQFLLPR
jgi:hypothetical protein